MNKGIIFLTTILFSTILKGQIITVSPESPFVNSNIVVIFDASLGNAGLKDYNGTVYAHTGVITTESNGSGDWKHVVSDWGVANPKVEMTSLGNNKYKIEFNIKSFYGIQPGEQVLELAFLFRNSDGSKVGRSENNGDIFYPISSDSVKTEYQSALYRNDSLIVTCSTGTIVIVPYTENIINIKSKHLVESSPIDSNLNLLTPRNVTTQFEETASELSLSTSSTKVTFNKTSLSIHFIEQGDTIVSALKPYSFMDSGGSLVFKLNDYEKIYGTGSRAIALNRRGQKLNVYNSASYGYSYGATNLNICLPIITSSNGYGLFIDNYSKATWDIGATNPNKIIYNYLGGETSFFYIGGKTYSNIINNITLLTGRQPLPPRWALGYIQSKFGYESEAETRSIVNTLRFNKFPIDAIVLDLYWFGSPQNMGKLNWDLTRFPNPIKMMNDFSDIGVKTILISETYFTQQTSNFTVASQNGYLGTYANGSPYIIGGFWAGNAGLLDITNPAACTWMWNFYKNRTDEGVGGWWTDLGEPENHPDDMIHFGGRKAKDIHNIYGLLWEKMISKNWKANYPTKRLFNLTRSGFVGMQQYSTFPWSGDIQRSFDGLKAQVPIMLSLGLTGIGYMHSDVGGFTGGGQDNELFTRWIQFGTFAPIFRVHGTGIPTEPTAYSQSTQTIVRNFLNLRYSLLPYNYSLAWLNSTKGEPLAMPIDYYEPQNTLLQNNNDEFFWGPNFLVAPILQQGQTNRNVIFPSGKWIDWWNGNRYNGNSTSNINSPIDKIPLFVKGGSFVPMTKPLLSTEFYKSDSLTINFYVDKEITTSEFTLFDDDGKTANSIDLGAYELIHFSSNTSDNRTEIYIESEGGGYPGKPNLRNLYFKLPSISTFPSEITVNSIPSNKLLSISEYESASEGWYWNSSNSILNIHIPWDGQSTTIAIENISVGIPSIEKGNTPISICEIFPNPAEDHINVSINLIKEMQLDISIIGIDGNLIHSFGRKKYSEGANSISYNVKNISAGLYFVKIAGEYGTSVKKWIKR